MVRAWSSITIVPAKGPSSACIPRDGTQAPPQLANRNCWQLGSHATIKELQAIERGLDHHEAAAPGGGACHAAACITPTASPHASNAFLIAAGPSTSCLQAGGRRHGPRYDSPTVRYKGSAVPLDYCKEFGKVGSSQQGLTAATHTFSLPSNIPLHCLLPHFTLPVKAHTPLPGFCTQPPAAPPTCRSAASPPPTTSAGTTAGQRPRTLAAP